MRCLQGPQSSWVWLFPPLEIPQASDTSSEHVLERTNTGTVTNVHDRLNLVPQPSSDPADPLNWSKPRKAGVLTVICFFPYVANYAAAVLGPALPALVTAFNPPETFSNLTHLIAVRIFMPIWHITCLRDS